MHRFKDAARAIDALTEAERSRPEVRFARARVAAELSDHARAVRELDGLEAKLPLLADEITRARAESALEAGPFDVAVRYYGQKTDAESLTRAAIALERSGQLDKARAAATKAVSAAHRQKKRATEREADARSVRARIAEKRGDKTGAELDLHWLAVNAPTLAASAGVDERLAKVAPKRALTADERYARALALANEGRVEQTERELTLAGSKLQQAKILHAKGWALYTARRDYEKAAELLESASKLGGEHAVSDAFYAARSRSRAQQDPLAIKMYDKLARSYPKSSWAEQARYLAARLYYIGGKWNEASAAYGEYLAKHGRKGRFVKTATYEQAVAWLAAGRHAKAAKVFGRLADAEERDRYQARYRELEAAALAGAGQKQRAVKRFRKVIDDAPLSFSALASVAHLAELKEAVPPLIEPGKAGARRSPLAVELPPKVKLLHKVGLDHDAEDALERYENSLQKRYAPRGEEALCRAYGVLSSAGRRYRVGQRAARWSELSQAPSSDSRWLWDCIYPRPYESLVKEAGHEWKLPAELVYAVMRQESAFRPEVVSPAKAVGLMQLIPPTARRVAEELEMEYDPLGLFSPPVNIRMGSYYLSKVLGSFGGSVPLAAAAYNAGPSTVARWLQSGKSLPVDVWVARIPYGETRGYVNRVVGNVARYAYLSGGEEAVPKLDLALPQDVVVPADLY